MCVRWSYARSASRIADTACLPMSAASAFDDLLTIDVTFLMTIHASIVHELCGASVIAVPKSIRVGPGASLTGIARCRATACSDRLTAAIVSVL